MRHVFKAQKFAMLLALVPIAACADRALGEDWEARVLASCEAVCEVSACNPLNGFYQDAPACVESCTTGAFMDAQSECAEEKLRHKDCMAARTCEEAEAYSQGVLDGSIDANSDYMCKEENAAWQAACPP